MPDDVQNQDTNQPDWRATLAGDKPERLEALKAFETPDKLFERLTAQPETPDWRKVLAGESPDDLKMLEGIAEPSLFLKRYRGAIKAASDGGRVRLPGEGATDEEKAEWAKAFGVAEAPDKYEIKATPPEGYEPSDTDKALLGRLHTKLHEAVSNGARAGDLMNIATQFYYDEAGQAAVASEETAAERALDAQAELKQIYGSKTDEMIGYATAAVTQFFPGDSNGEAIDEFLGLQLSSGHKLGDHPTFLRIMAQVGLEHAEDPFFQKMRGANAGFDPVKRKDEIMAMKDSDPKRYASKEIQDELDRINSGLMRQQGRAA